MSNLSLYNQTILGDDDFLAGFVARHDVLETLLRRLRTAEPNEYGPHGILIGPRGMGKTSLLRRIAIAINRDPDLAARYVPLTFREEQYNVLALGDFWRNCSEALAEWAEATGRDALAGRLDSALLSSARNDDTALEQFNAELATLQRRPVLLIDNIDLILDALPIDSTWTLRRHLQVRQGPIVIGAATQPLQQGADREAAFYEFFQPAYLEPLGERETEESMRALARGRGGEGERVLAVLDREPQRLRTLHTLTGGTPRILTLIYRLLESGQSGAAMADLDILLDQVTPYYKARVEDYQTPQQRAVIDAIALNWDPITTGDLSGVTNITSTTLSPLLIKLRKDGLIETVQTSGSYAGHQFVERFFNIWYLMRHGTRRTKQKMRWLVAFLTSFYSSSELAEIARRANDAEPGKDFNGDYALAVEQALARQSLQRADNENVAIDAGDLWRQGVELSEAGYHDRCLAIWDALLARFADAPEANLREPIARVLANKAFALGRMGDSAAAVVVYDEVFARFGGDPAPALREQVAKALFAKATTLDRMGNPAAAISVLERLINRLNGSSGVSLEPLLAQACVKLANAVRDSQRVFARAETFYLQAASAAPLWANTNLTWLYILANKIPDAVRLRASLEDLPAHGLALLDAAIAIAKDNFGSAMDALAPALNGSLETGGMDFTDDFDRLLRFEGERGYGEQFIAWLEATAFADRLAPVYVAFKAYVRGEAILLDVNPEVRQPARIIYQRLDAPRRHSSDAAPKKQRVKRRRK